MRTSIVHSPFLFVFELLRVEANQNRNLLWKLIVDYCNLQSMFRNVGYDFLLSITLVLPSLMIPKSFVSTPIDMEVATFDHLGLTVFGGLQM